MRSGAEGRYIFRELKKLALGLAPIVALVDQLLATLDEAELKQHVQHVAQVADEFELSRGVSEASIS